MAARSAASGKKPDARRVTELTKRMCASLLPGDTHFDDAQVRDAARFVLQTAASREPERSALAIESVGETSGTGGRKLRIAIVNDDMPFLVDSIASTIAEQGLTIDRLVHPVVPVSRDAKGRLGGISDAKDAPHESMIYIETDRIDAKHRRTLEQALRTTLGDVRAAVTDWPKMRTLLAQDADALADEEGAALLRWLNDGMLTQLGHLTRKRDGSHAQMLGICRKSARDLMAETSYDAAFAWFDRHGTDGAVPLIVKANRVSNVHRRVPLDLFILPLWDEGKCTALSIHAGVWTSAALAAAPQDVPRLRHALTKLMDQLDFDRGGHAGKNLTHALTALPHDLVIGFSPDDMQRVATTMMSLVDRPRVRLSMVEAPLGRHIFAFVWLPRDMLATSVRLRIQELLQKKTKSVLLDWSLTVEGGNLAMLRFVLDARDGGSMPDPAAVENELQTMLRGWSEAVETELAKHEEPPRATALAGRYSGAFPDAYRAGYGAEEAALDIMRLRRLSAGDDTAPLGSQGNPPRDARLYHLGSDPEGQLRLKIYQQRGSLPLSDAVPALENFGFRVLNEIPTQLENGDLGTIHDFTVALPSDDMIEPLLDRAQLVEESIAAVLNGTAEDDTFNKLIIATGLTAQEASWLRAFYRYLRQAGVGFIIYTVVDALRGAPTVTKALISMFRAMHDPEFGDDRDAAIEAADKAVRSGLAKVSAINDDRLLRRYRSLIKAILRTNAFAPAGDEALAFKIDSSLVPGLPKPVPWREIFVYSRRVEGIHLRSGPVARGGLRWSDRRDDFRTEILGLMKAQRVKNAVIVPTGAKGGFYPKQLPDPALDRDAWAAEGQASYELFIRTLLSITDNIVDDAVVHPGGVVIRDGEDPYFVVAADKGTARFSDVANGIAQARDFWLDDAFASGGSNGYDHKAMGITARGAWVSVQRHFLEMGVDVQSDPVDVAGCGDMSGDVFGNGMLLSRTIRLVAAFDHRHIFLDPDPDPAKSWQERQRLYDLPRSSWADYDAKLISKGGGVYPRDAKSIKLSKSMRQRLGIEDQAVDPDTLISAILTAPVDLIWFGGIGTYIKAAAENNAAVGDPANDRLRVDAENVRAKVIGEGANLGVTQAGRIEFALEGGRINTDFIDNSAGVDCSDNEVNIKIALAQPLRSGKLTQKRRNALLETMTEEVGEIVLEDNRLQALALSVAQVGGAQATGSQLRLMEKLEEGGKLDRRTEGLADSETLSRRASDGRGLTRPELAVLLSSTKLALQDAVEASDLPGDPGLTKNLIAYFPEPMRKKYQAAIEAHQLRREIIATQLANRIVNRMGIIHPFELAEEEGAGLADIAAAFVIAETLFDYPALMERLDTAQMSEPARLLAFDRAAAGIANHVADVLRSGACTIMPSEAIGDLSKSVGILTGLTDSHLASEARQQADGLRAKLTEAGVPQSEADMIAHLYEIDGAVGIANLAGKADIAPGKLVAAFSDIGERLGLDWAQSVAAMMNPSDVWERMLVSGLARDFQQMRLEFLQRMARRKDGKTDPEGTAAAWAEDHAEAIRQFRAMIARARAHGQVAPAMLAQIAGQARNLLSR